MTVQLPSPAPTKATIGIDRLTFFAFVWAGQAIVHQEFFESWRVVAPLWGWVLTFLAFLTLLFPRSLWLLTAMVSTSLLVGIIKWPFVANHILAENVINLTILIAILSVSIPLLLRRQPLNVETRNAIFDRFAPVVGTMLVVIYYFAFVAKLNTDFLSPAVSCANVLYGDLVDILPILPTGSWTSSWVIWGTLAVELAIPLLLTFRRTRYFGIALGLGFHFMLGLIGHRTFAAFAYALYAVYCMGPVLGVINRRIDLLRARVGLGAAKRYLNMARIAAVPFIALFLLALTDYGPQGLSAFRIDWLFWLAWSALIALIYLSAIVPNLRGGAPASSLTRFAKPGLLWVAVLLIVLTGLSQYLGLKTQTSLTMYSNLRTEGSVNNHLFMPALRLAGYQDDLVEIIETDHPELQPYAEEDLYITFFEFQRAISETTVDTQVRYRRGGAIHTFTLRDGVSSDPDLYSGHSVLPAKLLYFRPVSTGDTMACFH